MKKNKVLTVEELKKVHEYLDRKYSKDEVKEIIHNRNNQIKIPDELKKYPRTPNESFKINEDGKK